MTWLTNFVRPKIRALVGRSNNLPDNLWIKCSNCEQMIFHRDLEANLRVCTHCGHHLRMGALDRMKTLFDDGVFQTIELPRAVADPLKFRDSRRYGERLKEAQSKTGLKDAMAVAHGRMGGQPVVVACLGFEFMGGSMGMAVGEALIAASRLATLQRAALIVVTSSGGARMQEGILSLMQMPRTTIAVREVKEAGLPYVVVLADPTTGGVSASFAMLGDITLGEPGAVIGFAGARVISETIREKLPEGFQRAEYLLDHGMIDMVVPRHKLRDSLVQILGLLRNRGPAAEIVPLPGPVPQPSRSDGTPHGAPAE
ncbi:MAG: acetyl-CoA carboxylase, carboxyltransferase subunit beta [Alphaproteobacteria bacterium]